MNRIEEIKINISRWYSRRRRRRRRI